MKIKLLADENIARQKIEIFRANSFDIVSIGELGLAGQRIPDATILLLATNQERVVLTHNASDFKRLHREGGGHHQGILLLPDDVRHPVIALAAIDLLQSFEDWADRIERLHRPPAP